MNQTGNQSKSPELGKISVEQSIELCISCLEYLGGDRFIREKGLFRNLPSIEDIRKFRWSLLDSKSNLFLCCFKVIP